MDQPTIVVRRSAQGPRSLTHRGPNQEYIVLLNTGDRLWCQLAYQLSHELGHVLCRTINDQAAQHWFEEAFCEAMSIWTMEQMARTWQSAPPYPAWASYAESLAQYVAEVRGRAKHPEDLGAWYATQRAHLDEVPIDRPLNLVVAEQIAARGLARPESLRAFLHLRDAAPAENTIESLFATWLAHCPAECQSTPRELADLLKIEIPE